jgi:heme/copper-type cytochrome/quinol oxidase subunit 2
MQAYTSASLMALNYEVLASYFCVHVSFVSGVMATMLVPVFLVAFLVAFYRWSKWWARRRAAGIGGHQHTRHLDDLELVLTAFGHLLLVGMCPQIAT